jgi:hemerythrin-like domain-containing protein
MSMKITERLKAEHGVFLYQLDRLEDLVRRNTSLEILAAVVETIASAEDHHAMIEDQVLYPALVQANGGVFPLLRKAQAEHVELRGLMTRIRSGAFDEHTVGAFAALLRQHLEREIHGVFALAEDLIPQETLARMANWDVDHLCEAAGVPRPWAETSRAGARSLGEGIGA